MLAWLAFHGRMDYSTLLEPTKYSPSHPSSKFIVLHMSRVMLEHKRVISCAIAVARLPAV